MQFNVLPRKLRYIDEIDLANYFGPDIGCPVCWGCGIRRLHFCRGLRPPFTCWLRVVTHNTLGLDLQHSTWNLTWTRRADGESRSDQSAGHIKSSYLYNQVPTLLFWLLLWWINTHTFYLISARWFNREKMSMKTISISLWIHMKLMKIISTDLIVYVKSYM